MVLCNGRSGSYLSTNLRLCERKRAEMLSRGSRGLSGKGTKTLAASAELRLSKLILRKSV